MTKTIWLVGDGMLADIVATTLADGCRVVRSPAAGLTGPSIGDGRVVSADAVDMVIVARDIWDPAADAAADRVFRHASQPWLRCCLSFGRGVIGPWVHPSVSGCAQCADWRRILCMPDRRDLARLLEARSTSSPVLNPWATRPGLLIMACLIRDEVLRELRGETPRTAGHLYLVHLRTLDISRHAFLPNPQCPSCGEIPDDSAELATVVLRPSPKVHPSSYRCRPLSELKTVLERDYLDSQTGLLNAKVVDLATPFANVSVNLPLWQGDEGTAGRSLSFAESELTAILEGLERYCGLTPRGKRTVVCDSYRNLAEFALNPVSVGVHAPVQYERPDFPFQPFQPDQPMRWVWGYSFRQRRPLLVPELLAYYSLGGEGGYVYETSNGCALGGTLEEAIFHGILEIVERDAFLLTWYAQLPAPALNLEKTKDVTLRWMVDHVQADLGYRLHAYDITMEHGIPSVWVMAKNTRQKGPHLICAAGAHVSPVRAVKSAIHELVGMMPMLDAEYDARRAAALRMLEDPFQVRRMEDHSTLYSLPETELRFQFLFSQDGSAKPLAEAFMSQNHGQPHTDLTEDLKGMLQRFFDCGLDVIVVDQTSPEIRRNGLFCVKVLIPGMLPMTFGYHLTRLEGLDRVLRIPMQLGYANAPLSSEQLNPHPHPFP